MVTISASIGANSFAASGLNMAGWQVQFSYLVNRTSTQYNPEFDQFVSAGSIGYLISDRRITSATVFAAGEYDELGNNTGETIDTVVFKNGSNLISFVISDIDYRRASFNGTINLDRLDTDPGPMTRFGLLSGNDIVNGASFNDILVGGGGDDRVVAAGGNDTAGGDGGNDTVYGGSGNDDVFGQLGDDFVYGGRGNDSIVGDLVGNAFGVRGGRDALYGGQGSDFFLPGGGKDRMYLGKDRAEDFVVFERLSDSPKGAQRDTIYNFRSRIDVLDFSSIDSNSNASGFQEWNYNGHKPVNYGIWYLDRGKDVIVKLDVNGDRLADFELELVNVARLSAVDFVF